MAKHLEIGAQSIASRNHNEHRVLLANDEENFCSGSWSKVDLLWRLVDIEGPYVAA